MPTPHLITLGLCAFGAAAAVPAQLMRYELGRRLHAFEVVYEQADDDARARATPDLIAATTAFFGLHLGGAAQRLDAARFTLLAPAPPSDELVWAAAWACAPSRRLLDPERDTLHVRVEPVYEVEAEAPAGVRVTFELAQGDAGIVARREVDLAAAVQGVALDVPRTGDTTLRLRWALGAGDRVLREASVPIVAAKDLAARLRALAVARDGLGDATDSDAATLRYLERLLLPAARGAVAETDLPYLRLLVDAEAVARARTTGSSFLGTTPRGERWLCLAAGPRRLPVRIDVPATPAGPRPLLLLLHGAGGSENMFFDAYGAGKYVALARARAWIVVAPANAGGAVRDLVRAIADVYPVDATRVFLVGHSMGAAQAIDAAMGADGSAFAAVAALGGGGRVPRRAARDGTRFLVGVGAQDFARAGALSLHADLTRASTDVELREYANTEHLTIVQRACNDVFAWLEGPPAGK